MYVAECEVKDYFLFQCDCLYYLHIVGTFVPNTDP